MSLTKSLIIHKNHGRAKINCTSVSLFYKIKLRCIEKIKQNGYVFDKTVSVTTRAMRDGETDGVDYYFISKEDGKLPTDHVITILNVKIPGMVFVTIIEYIPSILFIPSERRRHGL